MSFYFVKRWKKISFKVSGFLSLLILLPDTKSFISLGTHHYKQNELTKTLPTYIGLNNNSLVFENFYEHLTSKSGIKEFLYNSSTEDDGAMD